MGSCASKDVLGDDKSTEEKHSQQLDQLPEDIGLMMSSAAADSKNEMQAENGRACSGSELHANIWSTLDDHLQEKIIARLPFRSLFQLAPSLSKTWRLRFGSASFQREIERSATSWESYAPLLSHYNLDIASVALFGYENSSQCWYRLPTHSYIPQDRYWRWEVTAGNGSLLCWIGHPKDHSKPTGPAPVLVTNPLTRSWRKVPPPPNVLTIRYQHRVVMEESSKAYKVILGSFKVQHTKVSLCIQIFDSTDGCWISESYSAEGTAKQGSCDGMVVRDGVLYILVHARSGSNRNIAFKYTMIRLNMKERTFEETPLEAVGLNQEPVLLMTLTSIHFCHLLVCGSNLMVVIYHGGNRPLSGVVMYGNEQMEDDLYHGEILSVFAVDLERGLLIEESRAPRERLKNYLWIMASRSRASTYIGGRILICERVSYDMGTREWHWFDRAKANLPPPDSTRRVWYLPIKYQPGLNPLLKV